MVRRRSRLAKVSGGNVRATLAAQLRARWEGEPAWSYYGRRVARLEAGEPVVVPSWAVSRWVWLPSVERGGTDHVRLEADGTVTPVEPLRVGIDIVAWAPVA